MKIIEKIPNNMKSIVIYCHGFGDNKDRIYQHDKVLNENGIGIISFDFPTFGEDNTDYSDFNIELCLEYLKNIVDRVNTYNVPINIVGSSFGGYIALLYINNNKNINKAFLKFPAVNFYECVKRKLNIDDIFFNNHEYYLLPSGYKIYRKAYYSFKENDIINNFNKNCDIYIMHGNKDKTVLIEDVYNFSTLYNIKLKVVDGAEHGMKNYLDLINEEMINYFK